ncbi:MAG: hypothetical protein NT179_00365 [Nitrospirae bacterium]|nr:hypothetical protein [Nitrospirota bacterium]
MSDQQGSQSGICVKDILCGLFGRVPFLLPWAVGAILALLIGSWLVWWAMHLQRQFVEDEIRAACQRVMPETVQRCVDTVVIQRGGMRR